MIKSLAATVLLTSLASPAVAGSSCVLELDGESHGFRHTYVVAHDTTFSDLDGVHAVTEHWIFCTLAEIEPNWELGDPVNAVRMEILMLDEDSRAEVHLAHDGRVRLVGLTWDEFEGQTVRDAEIPVRFEGTIAGGRARGKLETLSPVLQEPTPWYERDAHWQLTVKLDDEVLGDR